MMTLSFVRTALLCLAALAAGACASTPDSPSGPATFVDPDGLFKLEVGSSFRRGIPPNDLIPVLFQDQSANIVVIVVVDSPAANLDQLDAAVRINAESSHGQEAVRVTNRGRESTLGGIAARETEFVLTTEGADLVTFNLHAATQNENVQLIVGGPKSARSKIARVVERLRDGGFQFLRDVNALAPPIAMSLNDPTLPYAFPTLPPGWARIDPKELDPNAALAMNHAGRDLWLLASVFPLSDQQRQNIADDTSYFSRLELDFHKQITGSLAAVPPGNTQPYDRVLEDGDVRWSATGIHSGKIAVTYRMRALLEPGRSHLLYCWGPAAKSVSNECDALFDSMTVRPIPASVRPTPESPKPTRPTPTSPDE